MPRTKLPDKNFVWTPQLAYAVGLLVTDGNLSNDGRHIIMRSSEIEQLKNFKKCLALDNIKIGKSIQNNRLYFRVQFGSVQFYRWLIKIGLFPNKTYTIREINIPNKYFIDFLRGHLDGDGSITTYKDFYNTNKNPKYIYDRIWIKFISASEIHIIWLQNKIIKLLGVKGRIHEAKPRDNNRVSIWILKFAKKESLKLLPQIYYSNNIPCLQRKRNKAENFIKTLKINKS